MARQIEKLLLVASVALAVWGCDNQPTEKPAKQVVQDAPSGAGSAAGTGRSMPIPSDGGARSANTRCAEVGEGRFASAQSDACGGVWNIYASIAGGSVWYEDKMGLDPQAQRLNQQAEKIQSALSACGIQAEISLSDWFDSFTPDLVVVHSHPYASKSAANAELSRAEACGIKGYAKASRLQIAGRD